MRHVDVAGVDTKFVEHKAKVLSQLLTIVFPAERIHPTGRRFATRFRFRTGPGFTHLRVLSPLHTFPTPISDLQVRTDELASLDLSTVFVLDLPVGRMLPAAPGQSTPTGKSSAPVHKRSAHLRGLAVAFPDSAGSSQLTADHEVAALP